MQDILEKAEEYRKNCAVIGRAHYIAWERAAKWNRALGILVVLATAIVGTTIFGTLESNPAIEWKITAGLISLLATVLSSLQTYLRLSEQAEKHKASGAKYAALRRHMELFILEYSKKGEDAREKALDQLKETAIQLGELANESPSLPDKIWHLANRELGSESREQSISSN